ncbi:hypothetical protein P175DRAFT_0512594 [Aspergillus ochraceoroseus IBT 24754]|uniref:HNH domain-containing protein n=1 Tax=Aspergillus ochraceoroseus IBT 24754 TaxID=1392256 RepID=A0A2T5LLF2_9EURO|nr:uncharacterized protein P175DRAFT_0512594 [Aspergillus ochraceoroseus IBT 24754]PTU17116.1 hypothetical protein P175DRAFT_0512594 [Aspergillus ochraceoroseus IBT 24754]
MLAITICRKADQPVLREIEANYPVFRECVSSIIVAGSSQDKSKSTAKKETRSPETKAETDSVYPEELAEFIDVHTHTRLSNLLITHPQQHIYMLYNQKNNIHMPDSALDPASFLSRVLKTSYIPAVTRARPQPGPRHAPTPCEICARDWIPLSYHHLIPRGVHAKVRKRGWQEDVAWLCRACHRFVHRVASNEELAREWFPVERIMERIMEREDVRDWARWVGRVRWKTK